MPNFIEVEKVQAFLEWMKNKFILDIISDKAKTRVVKRGQVYKCNLGIGIGSEMQKERPCVIIQNDVGNLKSGNTIVAPVTHDTSKFPFLVPITIQYNEDGSLLLDGQVNVSNITCVSKARLGNFIVDLPTTDFQEVEIAVAKTIGLMTHYSKLKSNLDDKLKYIEKIKKERNEAEDFIVNLRKMAGAETNEQLEKIIANRLTE